jgi:glycosyltransferase involved in cell wall biosynthesis
MKARSPRDVEPPRVSILLPVRDADSTLATSLESVARQREVSFECLVLDDGSQDGSLRIAEKKAARDPRFRVLRLARSGIVSALNAGVGEARGSLLARIDADDWMRSNRLAVQAALLTEHAAWAAVGCRVRIFPRRQLGAGMRRYEAWLNGLTSPQKVRADAFVECPVAHPGLMIRREVARAFPYRDLPWPEDYDLILRLLLAGHEIGSTETRLLGWRHSPSRLSLSDPRYSQDAFTACKAEFLAQGFLRECERYTLWGHGETGRKLAKALAAHGKRAERIVEVHPRRIGRKIGGAPVVAPSALRGPDGSRLIASVSGEPARAEIRHHLDALGYLEGLDYVCAA